MLIVKAKIKEVAGDYNVAGDLAEALNKKVLHQKDWRQTEFPI